MNEKLLRILTIGFCLWTAPATAQPDSADGLMEALFSESHPLNQPCLKVEKEPYKKIAADALEGRCVCSSDINFIKKQDTIQSAIDRQLGAVSLEDLARGAEKEISHDGEQVRVSVQTRQIRDQKEMLIVRRPAGRTAQRMERVQLEFCLDYGKAKAFTVAVMTLSDGRKQYREVPLPALGQFFKDAKTPGPPAPTKPQLQERRK